MDEKEANDLVQKIQQELESDPDWLDKETSPCGKEEFFQIGAFIQAYCAADYNARRIIDAVRLLSKPPLPRIASGLNDADVYLHLRRCCESDFVEDQVKGDVMKAVETLEMHRHLRHHFAHWVAREVNKYKAFVCLTAKQGDPKKHGGIELSDGASMYAIIPRRILMDETAKIAGHADYLAQIAAYLENKSVQKS